MAHHRAGLARELAAVLDAASLEALLDQLEAHGRDERALDHASIDEKDRALLRYAMALTISPGSMTRAHVDDLRRAGCDDGEILDANQVTAYFAYANRVVDGLGVQLEAWHQGTPGEGPGEEPDPGSETP